MLGDLLIIVEWYSKQTAWLKGIISNILEFSSVWNFTEVPNLKP